MQINGKEIDFKIGKTSHAKAFESALKTMGAKEANVPRDAPLSEVLEFLIKGLRDFFIDATGVDVLVDCDDLEEAQDVYEKFLAEIKKQRSTLVRFKAGDIK